MSQHMICPLSGKAEVISGVDIEALLTRRGGADHEDTSRSYHAGDEKRVSWHQAAEIIASLTLPNLRLLIKEKTYVCVQDSTTQESLRGWVRKYPPGLLRHPTWWRRARCPEESTAHHQPAPVAVHCLS